MRCYHFGNYYMSSIQQGIQAAHSVTELFNKYCPHSYNNNQVDDVPAIDMLFSWSNIHKTMVCLNGGALQDLKNIEELMKDSENKYAWSTFYEDEESLGGILTNVCIVLPEYIYENAAKIRAKEYTLQDNKIWDELGKFVVNLSDFDIKLIELLNSCQLAR